METHKINIAGNETTITTPNGFGEMLVTAFASEYGYNEEVPDPENEGETMVNPVTETQFTATKILEYCRTVVASYNKKNARKQAEAQVEAANSQLASQIEVN